MRFGNLCQEVSQSVQITSDGFGFLFLLSSAKRMQTNPHQVATGFSRLDLVVLCCVACFLAVILFLSFTNAPFVRKQVRMRCEITLANIGERLQQYALENENRYPWMVSTNLGGTMEYALPKTAYRHFVALSNVIRSPDVLLCKYDARKPAKTWSSFGNSNLSYFVGIGSSPNEPGSVVSGDRSITWNTAQSPRQFWWNKNLGLHGGCGNLLMSDGSVLSNVDSNRLSEIFNRPENLADGLLVP